LTVNAFISYHIRAYVHNVI